VKEDKNGIMKAVGFFDKRDKRVYPTKSDFTQSWTAGTFSQPNNLNAGMGSSKPLIPVHILLSTVQSQL